MKKNLAADMAAQSDMEMIKKKLDRDQVIIRTSMIGIAANVFLAVFKAVVGFASNSVAIVMDAVNNFSDAASSCITIAGTKLAAREPDKKHPFGYGRIEYLSAMIISVLVLYAGITAFVESVKKIIKPETPDYSTVSLIIVAVAVIVKIALGRYVKKTGEKVNSDSLINSGEDATLDSVISAATLLAAIIFKTMHISLEAWLGAIIAVVIIRSAVDMLKDTLSKILGEGADAELARDIKKTINGYPEINGVYDMVMHNYGPDSYTGSVHIEVNDTLAADQLDELIRQVTVDVYKKHNVILTAIGVYSTNTKDPVAVEARARVGKIVMSNENVLQMHGFYINREKKTLRFDFVISFDEKDRKAVYTKIRKQVQEEFPDYELQIAMDTDFIEE
ncbi:MAG: cation transporter [Lachnospiraceae bacterium]|nr:cation transporter [Lachnospiraceae bacterium]